MTLRGIIGSWFRKPAADPAPTELDETAGWIMPVPDKVVTASAGQIDQLATFLEERSRLHAQGALYRVDGIAPENARDAYIIDTALMMLALSQCLVDDAAVAVTAEAVMRAAVVKANFAIPDDSESCAQMFDLATQRSIIEAIEGGVGGVAFGGWHSDGCILACALLHKGIADVGSKAVQLDLDVWRPYAFTKQVFGWRSADAVTGGLRVAARYLPFPPGHHLSRSATGADIERHESVNRPHSR